MNKNKQAQSEKMSTPSVSPQYEKENSKERYIQHTAALCFGLFFILIGFPLWWKTTEVYRVSLPYTDIQHLSEKKIEYLTEVSVVWAAEKTSKVELPALAIQLREVLGDKTQKDSSTLLSTYRVAVREAEPEELQDLQNAHNVSDLSSLFSTSHLNSYTVVITSSTKLLAQPVIAPFNNIFLPYNGAEVPALTDQIVQLLKDVVRSTSVVKTYDVAKKQTAQRPDDKDTMRSFRYHAGFDITFTLMVPEPDAVSVQWDIDAGVKDYLEPLLSSLDQYTKFSVTSQVLYFVSLGGKSKRDGDYFYYEEKDLPHVINPLESKLGSHASNNPGLNFIVCIPPTNKSPLQIKDSTGSLLKSDAFLSPRWGGVMIYNIDKSNSNGTSELVQLDMHKLMQVFVAQLRLLLNIQPQISTSEAVVLSGKTSSLHHWELSAWLRCRCVENLATSTSTLSSLAQLLEEIGNIVINDEIGKEVEFAVTSIKSSHYHLANGNLREAFLASRDALKASELAFFHPSLLELLYFPEDQKFAIYIPLFLPISIPVVTSTVQAIKWLRGLKKAKKD